MNSISYDVKDILDGDSSVGLTYGTDLFISRVPEDSPHECVTIFDTGGYESDGNTDYERPTFQVHVRGSKGGGYTAGYALARSIYETLHRYANQAVNSTTYHGIWCTTNIIFIGYDERDRPVWTINFRAHRSAT